MHLLDMSNLKELGNICLEFRSSEWAKSGIFASNVVIISYVNLRFLVLNWYRDAFLAEDMPKFPYDTGNVFF